MSSTEEMAAAYILPPRAGQNTAITVSAVAASQDLRLCGVQVPAAASYASKVGFQGRYVTLHADGADVGFVFGPTSASVTGANAPVLATVGVNVAGVCERLSNGERLQYYVAAGTDVFIGFVATGAGVLRILASSP